MDDQNIIAELIATIKAMPDIRVYHNRRDERYLDVTVVNASDFGRIDELMGTLIYINELRRKLLATPERRTDRFEEITNIAGELLRSMERRELDATPPDTAPVAAVAAQRRLWPMDPRHITIYERFSNNPSRHLASLTDPVMPVCGAKCVWSYEPQKGYVYPDCPMCYRSDATSAGSE